MEWFKDSFWALAFIALVVYLFYRVSKKAQIRRREKFISEFRFPHSIAKKVLKQYPHLNPEELKLVEQGLREYFQVCQLAGRKMVSMPSQVIDLAWHEFILFTKKYERFSKKAFGFFLHHTPAEAMSSQTVAQKGIKRAWRISCFREGIDPKSPHKLPLIFAIDSMLNIHDGFKYSLQCKSGTATQAGPGDFCATHIGCGGCGSGVSFESESSNSDGCGSSCGGGGCGGGD